MLHSHKKLQSWPQKSVTQQWDMQKGTSNDEGTSFSGIWWDRDWDTSCQHFRAAGHLLLHTSVRTSNLAFLFCSIQVLNAGTRLLVTVTNVVAVNLVHFTHT
jgi:hypothetical protein